MYSRHQNGVVALRGWGTLQRKSLSQIQKCDQTDLITRQSMWGWGGRSQVRVRCREEGREEHSRERKAYRTACRCQWGSTRGPVWGTASCSVICCPGHKWKHVGRWGLESWCVWWGAGYRIVSRTATRSDSTSTSGIVKCGAWSGGVRGSTQWAQREGSSCNYQRKWFRLLKM